MIGYKSNKYIYIDIFIFLLGLYALATIVEHALVIACN